MTHLSTSSSRRLLLPALALSLLLLSACKTTTITSEPPGAEVWLNDKYVGKTPVNEFKVPQEIGHMNKYRFKAFLDGYETATQTFYESPMMNVLDVVPSKINFKMTPLKRKSENPGTENPQPEPTH